MIQNARDGRRESRPFRIPAVATMAAALVFGMMASAPVSAQTLVNGNFEATPQKTGYTTVFANSYLESTPAWKVTLNSVDIGTAPAQTSCRTAGAHCVDLNGNDRGRIEQKMESAAGAKCTVNFYMSRHKSLAGGSATMHTFVNGAATSPGTWVHNVAGVSANDGKWEAHSFSFTTVGTSTTLAFESAIAGMAGPQVDDVTMSCAIQNPTGSLAVKKVVVNNTGGPIPLPAAFATTTHCSANAAAPGITTQVPVPGGTTVTQQGALAAGIGCSVTEVLPQNPTKLEACKGGGATWTMAYSPPVTIVAGQTALLTVTNTLTCNPPTGGTLQIHKSVVNTLSVPTPQYFNMLVSCSGMNPIPVAVAVDATVTVPPAGQIANGTVCTIVETLPPQVTGLKACASGTASWVASSPGPLTVHTAQTTGTIITNTLTCDKVISKPGFLKVVKSVTSPAGVPVSLPTAYPMAVNCTPSGVSSQNISVVPGPNGTTISGIAAPSQCSVVEQAPPPVPGCSWTSTTSPSQPVAITAGTMTLVTVHNVLTCAGKPTGTLKVMKSVNNATGGPITVPATFAMTVSCTPQPLQNPSIAVAPGPVGTTVSNIAAPSQCTVTEAQLPQVAHAEGCKGGSATWSSVIVPAQPVPITANNTTTVTVRNTLTCDKPTGGNCAPPSQNYIGCRVTVLLKRSKGPALYSVLVSPPAPVPVPTQNAAPSTSSSCAIPGGAMINSTSCWFNYTTVPQAVTLTATSSTGALPAGFSWGGACSGTNAVCVVTATLTQLIVQANFP